MKPIFGADLSPPFAAGVYCSRDWFLKRRRLLTAGAVLSFEQVTMYTDKMFHVKQITDISLMDTRLKKRRKAPMLSVNEWLSARRID